MFPSVYVKLHPLIRPALASPRMEPRRCLSNVPEYHIIRLPEGRKQNALPCGMDLQRWKVSGSHRPR